MRTSILARINVVGLPMCYKLPISNLSLGSEMPPIVLFFLKRIGWFQISTALIQMTTRGPTDATSMAL